MPIVAQSESSFNTLIEKYNLLAYGFKGIFTNPCAVICKRCLFTLDTHFCRYWGSEHCYIGHDWPIVFQ